MAVIPTEIKRDPSNGLIITWSGGEVSKISRETLRRKCPCAECREKRGDGSHEKPLTGKKRSLMIVENTIDKEIDLQRIWGVGQYALGMSWGDGHSTGIYTFEYLRELSFPPSEAGSTRS